MSKQLDILVDKYLTLQDKKVFQDNIDEDSRILYVNATKKEIKNKIYKEIKEEVRAEAILEAQHAIEENERLKRINEFKTLMVNGFVVAIFVGLFVNQITDFIGYWKGSIKLESVWPTVIIAFVFILICIFIFVWMFLSEFIKIMTKGRNDEKN